MSITIINSSPHEDENDVKSETSEPCGTSLDPMLADNYAKLIERANFWDATIKPKDPRNLLINTPTEYVAILQLRLYLAAAVKSATAKALKENQKGLARACKSQKFIIGKKK